MYKWVFLLVFFIGQLDVKAQQRVVEHSQSVLLLEILATTQWKNENQIQAYAVGLLGVNTKLQQAVLQLFANKTLKGKPVKVKVFTKISDIDDVQVLVLGGRLSQFLFDAKKEAEPSNALVVSIDCGEPNELMLNFYLKPDEQVALQVNTANIEEAGIVLAEDVLLFADRVGESASADSLHEELLTKEKRIQKQNFKLKILLDEILAHKDRIDKQRSELREREQQIELQESQLKQLSREVNMQEHNLKSKANELQYKTQQLEVKQVELEKKRKQEEQQLKVLSEQNKRIEQQGEVLDHQNTTIETQKDILYIFLVFLLIVVTLLFFIYRSNKINKEIAAKLDLTNKYITSSLQYAQNIQQAILPMDSEIKQVFNFFVVYRPKDIVSGDFYWFTKVESTEGKEICYLAVVDCTGHGVPGAFMSLIGNRLLNEIVVEKQILEPSQILTLLDEGVAKSLRQKESNNRDGMDMSLCKFEHNNGSIGITFAGAKRPVVYFDAQSGKMSVYKTTRRSIGGTKALVNKPFKEYSLTAKKGDLVYLMTDGLVDQNDENRRPFGVKKLMTILEANANLSLQDQKRLLENALNKHKNDQLQRDDITLLGIKL